MTTRIARHPPHHYRGNRQLKGSRIRSCRHPGRPLFRSAPFKDWPAGQRLFTVIDRAGPHLPCASDRHTERLFDGALDLVDLTSSQSRRSGSRSVAGPRPSPANAGSDRNKVRGRAIGGGGRFGRSRRRALKERRSRRPSAFRGRGGGQVERKQGLGISPRQEIRPRRAARGRNSPVLEQSHRRTHRTAAIVGQSATDRAASTRLDKTDSLIA
jgi:hypothetical protein